jgi:FAD/FMN-containing dehydrogenase
MPASITNYDGGIVSTPQVVARPATVGELQEILRNKDKYPGPVRAMGSYHSLTPCASSTGTIVDMDGLDRVLRIDAETMTVTAQAGAQLVKVAAALRKLNLQCQTKDSLDGVELGQVNSYLTGIKWVSPSGSLEEASLDRNPDLLPFIRASYGLAGIVYEVTFKLKPLEIIRFSYDVHEVEELTQELIEQTLGGNQTMVCWTLKDKIVLQTRNAASELKHEWLGNARRFGWNFLAAFVGRGIREHLGGTPLGTLGEDVGSGIELGFYRLLSAGGGFTLHAPDKTVNYSKTPMSARYVFTFWAFPRADYARNLRDYVAWADAYYKQHGFRCNMPLGSYFIHKDTSSLLSYSYDGDILSLDPIHSPGEKDRPNWDRFLQAFNEWAHARGGVPLLNQSPFVKREHVVAAYGERWTTLCNWLRTVDPDRRMVNEFFGELLV